MSAATAFIAALTIAIGVGALFLWFEPTAAPYGWGVNGIAADTDDDAEGPTKTGIDATIAAIVARTKGGGNVVEAFQDQGGIRFATPRVSAARAAAVLRARASKHDPEEDIERTARHLAAACRLSERLGCAVSRCLEAVAANHRRESKAYDLKQQAFAGPKATIKLLSAMPVLTIVAGEFMGAHSFRFLTTTIPGWICLAIGAVWYGAGMAWTHRMLDAFGEREDTDENLPIALEMLGAALGQGSSIPGGLIAVGTVLEQECTEDAGTRHGATNGIGLHLGRRKSHGDDERQPLARGMREAGLALTRGAGWREAWLGANAAVRADPDTDDPERERIEGRRRNRRRDGIGWNSGIGRSGASAGNRGGHGGERRHDDGEERVIGIAALHPSMAVLYDCLGEAWSHGASPTERLALAAREYDREQLSAIEQEAARLSVKLLLPSALCFLPAFVMVGIVPAIASLLMG